MSRLFPLTEEAIVVADQCAEFEEFLQSAPGYTYFKIEFLQERRVLIGIYDDHTDEQIIAKVFDCGHGYEQFKTEYLEAQRVEQEDVNAHLATGHCDWEELGRMLEDSSETWER
jgi:hypothetical protein